MPGIDLHAHTTASDGTLSPAELVRLAADSGLEAVAVTDHDTVGGLEEALATGREIGMEVIPGCELSVEYPGPGFMHILGLYVPTRPERLMAGMRELNDLRARRNERIVQKLQDLGLDVTYEAVLALAGGTVGRPHIARAIIDAGGAASVQQAFDQYLGENGKAYVPKDKFSPQKAIGLLRDEGATVVLAHPYSIHKEGNALEREIRQLADWGLEGLECLYSLHSPGQTKAYQDLARRLGLLVTGGSDFHGAPKPDIRLGVGRGDLSVPYSVLEALKDHRRAQGLSA